MGALQSTYRAERRSGTRRPAQTGLERKGVPSLENAGSAGAERPAPGPSDAAISRCEGFANLGPTKRRAIRKARSVSSAHIICSSSGWSTRTGHVATIQTCGGTTDFDTTLYVREGTCVGADLACNDDGGGPACGFGSSITVPVVAGTTYFIVVDGFAAAGDFTLSVE